MDEEMLFIPIQVPYRGGYRDWHEEEGRSEEEDYVVKHGSLFTKSLCSLLSKHHWVDKAHVDRLGAEKLLRHACGLESVSELLNRAGDRTPIVCVLSDGWNRTFNGEADRSRYWRCRLDFDSCTSLSQFKNWCNHYANWRPVNTETLALFKAN